MAEVTFDVTPATPQKRPYEDEDCAPLTSQDLMNSAHKTSSDHTSRDVSPAPSSLSSLTELTNNDVTKPQIKLTPGPQAKKPKLTFQEKEAEKAARKREKEEKERVKAGEKARKDEEKARKDEEKRKANEERENAKRAKDLEKTKIAKEKEAKKQAEQQKKDAKEAERLKKERAQMRLGAFFAKPRTEATPPSTPDDVSEGASSRRSSIASVDMERSSLDMKKPTNPEFEKFILPFYIPEYTDVAPINRFKLSRTSTFEVTRDSTSTKCDIREQFGRPQKRMRRTVPVREIMRNMQASGLEVIDLDSVALEALGRTSYKNLQFREDVRPPYRGTYSRIVSPRSSRKTARNPFTRGLPDTNYDYDSEAEWEPPAEDDEDLENDDEMSDAEDNEEDMADFLDDADDSGRRKGPVIDMEPISSGLCWAGEAFDDNGHNIRQYAMDVLHESATFPIDPFSTKYWPDLTKPKPVARTDSIPMPPPRQALSSLSPNAGPTIKQEMGVDGKPLPFQPKPNTNQKKPLKMIEPEFMPAFKQAIDGNDMTKAGLIEVLKKQFPKCSKDAIKDTIGLVAVRVGKKESEKKWQLIDAS